MFKSAALLLMVVTMAYAADFSTRKALNLAAIKTMVAAAEAEAQKRNVQVTICVVDDSGNLLYLQKGDGAGLNTIQFCQKKARHSAFYKSPSKAGADELKRGNLEVLAFPDFFPNQGVERDLPDRLVDLGRRAANGDRADRLAVDLNG